MKRVCMLVTDGGSIHGRKRESFGSTLVRCCTSDDILTLHCASDEMSAEHHNLLLHNDVRWLSKGKALERFCDLREEITAFLLHSSSSKHKKAETHLNRILGDNFMADVCFLSDIFKHPNDLNVGLPGRDARIPSQTGPFRN
ncbi:SCAN domain-containing protein 3 [Merluccius polli]|uniref:SCAN domain-containing protein 3 n=1 Tax=Merluccius polli TaxID=89951 RepID=A0AA47NTQ8_MERPO|nr:SCAN domain-containing protein 3 [Merluccius polli]